MRTDTFDLLKTLGSYPVFTLDDVCSLADIDPGYGRVLLHRLASRGLIRSVQRNRYTTHDDPRVVATHLVWPSYISLWSALRHHDLTEQVPEGLSVLTTSHRHTRTVVFMNTPITFTTIPTDLLFGYSKVSIGGLQVFMADAEKSIVDSVILKKISLSEIYSVISANTGLISSEKMVDHLIRSGNRSASKRIGWILERLKLPGADTLKKHIYRTSIPLDYSRSYVGYKDPSWGVLVNMEVGT